MLKKCNKCGFQQDEFLNLGGRNYCKSCNYEINNNVNTAQSSITLSAYEKEVVQDVFWMTMEVLEKYIERANYYSDWQVRRKIRDNKVTREFSGVEEAETILSSNLVGLKITVRNKPPFLLEELRGEYYKWINATGIDINNISPQAERLKHWLFEVNEVLKGKGERFFQEVRKECREHVEKMSNEEFSRKMNAAFVAYNPQLNKEREIASSLEGQTYKDVKSEKRFGGDDEKDKGERTFELIANNVAGKHDKFDYYQKQSSQQRSNSEIIQDVKNSPRNWRKDEVITEYDNRGEGTKRELALIHNSAEVGFNGAVYNWQQPIYLPQRFDQAELAEINQALNISQTSTSQHYQKNQSVSDKFDISKTKTPNSNDSNLGTVVIVSSILLVASLGIYGIIKKSKKIKK